MQGAGTASARSWGFQTGSREQERGWQAPTCWCCSQLRCVAQSECGPLASLGGNDTAAQLCKRSHRSSHRGLSLPSGSPLTLHLHLLAGERAETPRRPPDRRPAQDRTRATRIPAPCRPAQPSRPQDACCPADHLVATGPLPSLNKAELWGTGGNATCHIVPKEHESGPGAEKAEGV